MIADWSDGYVTDIGYTFGYYPELHPALLRLACLDNGIEVFAHGPITYLELGFGHGLSLNIHSASVPGSYWGTDFNPDHVTSAKSLSRASGAELVLLDASFTELAQRTDLPQFDVIALHGIWTWVSNDSRRAIVDILRKHLKVGGIVYNSYNCRPGWAPSEPLRHLMTLYSELATTATAGTANNVENALAYCQRVADAGALYFQANPAVQERLKRAATLNRHYLAHEYFNRNWEVMSFSQMAEWLEPAKLTYAASAHLLDHVDAINLSEQGQKLLAETRHLVMRETLRDYLINQQFRRDIFVKGPEMLTRMRQAELLKAEAFVLVKPAANIPLTVMGALGEAKLQEAVYEPLIAALAENGYAPRTAGDLAGHGALKSASLAQVVQALMVLVGAGHAFPAQTPTKDARIRCAALNQRILEVALGSGDISFLASPVTGSGVIVDRLQQLFLRAHRDRPDDLAGQAEDVWRMLSATGQTLAKEGKPLTEREENLAEIRRQMDEFMKKKLPLLTGLGILLDGK